MYSNKKFLNFKYKLYRMQPVIHIATQKYWVKIIYLLMFQPKEISNTLIIDKYNKM